MTASQRQYSSDFVADRKRHRLFYRFAYAANLKPIIISLQIASTVNLSYLILKK